MCKVKISFYGVLVKTTGENETEINASTLREAFGILTAKYGKPFEERVYDGEGNLRRFINIYVNGKDIRFLDLFDTELNNGSDVSIIPAVSGG